MKKLLAFITIASLTLGTAAFAFADEVVEGADVVEVTEEVTEEVVEEEAVEEVVEEAAPVVEEIVPVALKYEVKTYVNKAGTVIGTYPDIIAKKAVDAIEITINNNPQLDTAVNSNPTDSFVFEVEELATASKITMNYNYSRNSGEYTDVILVVYVDNATGAEVSEDVFTALIPVEEAVEEVPAEEVVEEVPTEEVAEEAAEPVLVPLRAHAEALGYTVNWSPEGTEITDGVNSTTIVLDVNAYTTFEGEVVELDAAPVSIEGTIYVTVEFFSEILGANVVINADGSAVITGEVVEAPVVEEEAPVEEEAAGEEEAPAEEEATGEEEAPAEEEVAGEEEVAA